MNDGFGAQYQKIISTFIYCKLNNLSYVYKPFNLIEHNYNNDKDYIEKKELLINLKKNIENIKNNENNINLIDLDFGNIIMPFFENNIDLCCKSQHMQFIKNCFWENKERDFYKNGKYNIAVHIRRPNSHDNRIEGANTKDNYYLDIINKIRDKYSDKDIQFHIYSQGNIENFKLFENDDVKLYLDTDIESTFIGMIAADILITSASSFSYVAALMSDGIIYYKKLWHNPCKEWIINN